MGNLTRAAYATAYDACTEIANFKLRSGVRGLRYVAIHVACLLIMFLNGRLAMPLERREKARHATLLFCALERRVLVKVRRERKKIK